MEVLENLFLSLKAELDLVYIEVDLPFKDEMVKKLNNDCFDDR